MRCTGTTLALLAVSVAAVGCGVGGSSPSTDQSFPNRYAEYLAGGLDSAESAEVEAVVFHEVENQLAACMQAEGFAYVPEDDPRRFSAPPRSFFTQQDAAAHGYGIVAGYRDVQQFDQQELSPNDVYIRGLDPATQQAFFVAFEGEVVGPEPGGCRGEAHAAALDKLGITDVSVASQQAQVDLMNDPRMVAADQQWRSCVSDLGITTGATSIVDFTGELYIEFESVDQGDEASIQAFQDREIELATTMLDCNATRNAVLHEILISFGIES